MIKTTFLNDKQEKNSQTFSQLNLANPMPVNQIDMANFVNNTNQVDLLNQLNSISQINQVSYDSVHAFVPKEKWDPVYRLVRRILDVTVSLFFITFTWPIMLYVANYIRRRNLVNPLFRQVRMREDRRSHNSLNGRHENSDNHNHLTETLMGENLYLCPKTNQKKPDRRKKNLLAQPFKFYKFQTMYPDAKQRFPHLYKYQYSIEEIQRMKFKIKDDPRVPPWALRLRINSLDELPNFFNVIKGDLTLVGPRPDIPEMLKYYTPEQLLKLKVKPGVTGYAQVYGRGDLTFQETLKWDVEYVKRQSFVVDMKILLRTILVLLKKRGAY